MKVKYLVAKSFRDDTGTIWQPGDVFEFIDPKPFLDDGSLVPFDTTAVAPAAAQPQHPEIANPQEERANKPPSPAKEQAAKEPERHRR